jgi:imidazolonepropionase-like amidohydrolase
MKYLFFYILMIAFSIAFSQNPLPINGVANPDGRLIALVGGTVHTNAENSFEGNILIRNGRIIAIGKDMNVPKDAVVHNFKGRHIYPGMIDLWSDVGLPNKSVIKGHRDLMERNDRGVWSWNMAIHPETNASSELQIDESAFVSLRKLGFTAACSHLKDGISRGTGAFFNLSNKKVNEVVILPQAASFYSFNKGSSMQDYPSSLMGSIALLRQTFLDIQWYQSGANKSFTDLSLQAFIDQRNLPKFFETTNWRDILRAHKIGSESGIQFYYKGSGDEYQRLDELKKIKPNIILPLNYPEAWDVKDAFAAKHLSLHDMWHWEAATANAALLSREKIPISFTTSGLKTPADFWSNLSKAVKAGLPASEAIRACTESPAKWLGAFDQVGSIEVGKIANFMIFGDTLFAQHNPCLGTWVQGEWYPNGAYSAIDIQGDYSFELGTNNSEVKIELVEGKLILRSTKNDKTPKVSLQRDNDRIDFVWKDTLNDNNYRMNGSIISYDPAIEIQGLAVLSNGTNLPFVFKQLNKTSAKLVSDTLPVFTVDSFSAKFPFTGFGNSTLPAAETVLYSGATIWTSENEELPFVGDILIHEGKILSIGKDLILEKLLPKGVTPKIIQVAGKHITPGIIDEHSHIAIEKGVNEGTQNNTAEVRIGDVLYDKDDVMYYQLAGGVTSAQLLHGSANPIGGQSAIIKLRWGKTPEELKNSNAPGHIKFALGENVKQSNWGDRKNTRFPQTRMGVEQVYFDAFQRAEEYQKEKALWQKSNIKQRSQLPPFRQDLELEAIAEILEGKRNITCHSYVQSEINMLMHVADSMGFKVNTFTHILEGYKLADKLKAHGANASTFSDWWAYKFEVNDAIPYNASILTKMGVNTSINSDDGEMGRRLNQEAAKSIMYGGLTEIQALKLVTINPAKMLKIDTSTGSLKVGKDADLVIWSDNPLSISAKVESTIIDGVKYYDAEAHAQKLKFIESERTRIIDKLLAEPSTKLSGKKPPIKKRHEYHCDDLYNGEHLEMEVSQ